MKRLEVLLFASMLGLLLIAGGVRANSMELCSDGDCFGFSNFDSDDYYDEGNYYQPSYNHHAHDEHHEASHHEERGHDNHGQRHGS